MVRSLIDAVGPLTSTSANGHGSPPIQRPEELPFPVDAQVPGEPGGQAPSTVLHGLTGAILRRGPNAAAIERTLADLRPQG